MASITTAPAVDATDPFSLPGVRRIGVTLWRVIVIARAVGLSESYLPLFTSGSIDALAPTVVLVIDLALAIRPPVEVAAHRRALVIWLIGSASALTALTGPGGNAVAERA